MGFLTTQKYKVHYIVKKDFLKQRTIYDKVLKWPLKMNIIILLSFFVFLVQICM